MIDLVDFTGDRFQLCGKRKFPILMAKNGKVVYIFQRIRIQKKVKEAQIQIL